MILRRSRGYAPGVAAKLPIQRPVLAVGADLKNAITLVVDGQAFVSQHIGDLDQYGSRRAFEETIRDLVGMYEVGWDDLLVVHDLHPEYVSTVHARSRRKKHGKSALSALVSMGQATVRTDLFGAGNSSPVV